MTFIELPSYAEAIKRGYNPFSDEDNMMGERRDNIVQTTKDEVEKLGTNLGINYRPSDECKLLVNPVRKKAVLYDNFYEESKLPVAGLTVLECSKDNNDDRNHQDKQIQPGSDEEIFVEEENLRALAEFHL